MSKKLKIIIIIILAISLVLLGSWLFSRNKAIKNNSTPPTFREFLSIGSNKKASKTIDNQTGSSDFTKEDTPVKTVIGNQNIPTTTSIFTSGKINPAPFETDVPSDQIIGGGDNQNTGNGITPTSGGIIINPNPQTVAPICSESDTNITFTPQEIARLNALKTRFFAIAESLNTDADVATELANYDTFKTKTTKLTELYNYCINSPVYTLANPTPNVPQQYGSVVTGTNGAINYRVPTPFWHDINKDNQAFIHQGSNFNGIFSDPDFIFPERSIEHALRLNLW
jgi:hypothetical protein